MQPDEAFGAYREKLARIDARSIFPTEPQLGVQFEANWVIAPEGMADDDWSLFTVIDIVGDNVVLDGNPPLRHDSDL